MSPLTYQGALKALREAHTLNDAKAALRALWPLCEDETDRDFAGHVYEARVRRCCEYHGLAKGKVSRAEEHATWRP